MTVYILLRASNGIVGNLISWQTRGPYCHAAIEVDGMIYEAGGGNGLDPVKCYPSVGEWDRYAVEVENPEKLIGWLRSQLGKPYDWRMVLRFVTRQQEARETSGKWFCSELVFAALKHAGVSLFNETEPWEVSPSMLPRSPLTRRAS